MVPAWGIVLALFWPGGGLLALAQAVTEGTTGPEGMVWEYGPAGLENIFRPLGPTLTPVVLAEVLRLQGGPLDPGSASGDSPPALTWTPLEKAGNAAWPDGPAWGWYRTRFTAPAASPAGGDKGVSPYRLHLGRVGDAAMLFVNGLPIARHRVFRLRKPEEPLPFACCILPTLLRPGAANEVAVEVYTILKAHISHRDSPPQNGHLAFRIPPLSRVVKRRPKNLCDPLDNSAQVNYSNPSYG